MPDVAVHIAFGEEVLASLPEAIRNRVSDTPFRFALLGPDVWFMHKPWIRQDGRGRRMHTTRTGAFLTALAEEALRSNCPDLVFSYLAGFLCHYALDATAHPYIIYRTTKEPHPPGAHRALEHSIDIRELGRQGFWGERHPMTGHGFRKARLPAAIGPALEAAYHRVYGWTNVRKTLNRAYWLFRFLYRLMENPWGICAGLARLTRSPALRSLAYSQSPYAKADVENEAHAVWRHSHDESLSYTESFAELRAMAKESAIRMISAVTVYLDTPEHNPEKLRAAIGNRSYLSGLPVDDPRNWAEPTMLPSHEPEQIRKETDR